MLHITICDKPHEGLRLLLASTRENPLLRSVVLGLGTKQRVGHGRGFGLKLSLLKEYLMNLKEDEYIIFTDAFDVLFQTGEIGINKTKELIKWIDNNQTVLFAKEEVNWPDKNLVYTRPKYLNSGVFAGRAKHILELLQVPFTETTDDQLYYAKQYIQGKGILDQNDFFVCFHKAKLQFNNKYVSVDNKIPLVLHINNGLSRFLYYEKTSVIVLGESVRLVGREVAWSSIFKYWKYRFHFLIFLLIMVVPIIL